MKTINSEISQILIKIDQNMLQLIYKIVQQINKEMEAKRYCVAIFLDVLQAFDKVWHELYKKNLPINYYYILNLISKKDILLLIKKRAFLS